MTNEAKATEYTPYEEYEANIRLAKQGIMNVVGPLHNFIACLENEDDLRGIRASISIALRNVDDALKSIRRDFS